jgi:hypothetical protein
MNPMSSEDTRRSDGLIVANRNSQGKLTLSCASLLETCPSITTGIVVPTQSKLGSCYY